MHNYVIKYVYCYNSLHVSSNSVLIIRRSNCINTAPGTVFSVSDVVQVEKELVGLGRSVACRQHSYPAQPDEDRVARNMYRIIIIIKNVLYNVIVHQVGHLPRVVPTCTVSKT